MKKMLSIITVTYNAESYLERTLKSIESSLAEATDPEILECLLIDGKSEDRTLEVALGHDQLITKIISEPDKGLYDAMNKGLALATGKYVWFLNAGDEVHDKSIIKSLIENFENEADVYYSDALLVREDGTELGLRSKCTPHKLPKDLKWEDFSTGMKVCHQAFIVKRAIAPHYDVANLSADIDWEIKCLKLAKKTKFLNLVLCRYLMGGLSVKNHRRSLLDRFQVLRAHFGFFSTLVDHTVIFWRGFWFARANGRYW